MSLCIFHNRQCLETRKRIYTYPQSASNRADGIRSSIDNMHVASDWGNMDALVSPAMGHCPLDFRLILWSLQSRANWVSFIGLYVRGCLHGQKYYRPVVLSLFITWMDVSIKLLVLSLSCPSSSSWGRHWQDTAAWAGARCSLGNYNQIHLSIPPYNVYSIQIMLKLDNRKLNLITWGT